MPKAIHITSSDCIPEDERYHMPRYLGFRPIDGQACPVNPPRFCWPFDPNVQPQGMLPFDRTFRLRIARNPEFDDPVVEVTTSLNFYNALPELAGSGPWFWQVTYDPETANEVNSIVRSFDLAPDATAWDRTVLMGVVDRLKGHPHVIFTPENIEALRALQEEHAECGEIARQAIKVADETLDAPWFLNFPKVDTQKKEGWFAFAGYSQYLHNLAFAFLLTRNEKYLAVKDRLLALASYPPGGYASPEGIGPAHKFSTKIIEHLGVAFDWLYDVLTPDERDVILAGLEWRIDYIYREFSWLKNGNVNPRGIAVSATSHAWENITWTLTGALAIAEHSEAARTFVEMGLHYLIGVGSGFAQDEGWNEGVSYSNWKFGSLVAASMYATMTVPGLHLERNPFYRSLGDFFLYQAPVGVIRPAWGDMGYQYRYHTLGQHAYRRKLAYLTGDRRLLTARESWEKTFDGGDVALLPLGEPEVHEITDYPRPWVEYVLPHFFSEPEKEADYPKARIFPVAGWAMGFSKSPGTLEAFRKGVGFVMNCRPRGGYSHSHHSNSGFELYAYGQVIATGGGSKSNSDFIAKSSQSHNVVLINGEGQGEVTGEKDWMNAGRIVAWKDEKDLVYACSDVQNAYVNHPGLDRFKRHFLFVKDCYFVVYDDLALSSDADPAMFSWLYHIQPDVPVTTRDDGFDYAIGDVNVQVHHLGETGSLEIVNMLGRDWYRNPVTGEDQYEEAKTQVMKKEGISEFFENLPRVHNNLWVNTKARRDAQFLSVIVPFRHGEQAPEVQKLAPGVISVKMDGDCKDVIAFGTRWNEATVMVDCDGVI